MPRKGLRGSRARGVTGSEQRQRGETKPHPGDPAFRLTCLSRRLLHETRSLYTQDAPAKTQTGPAKSRT